MDMSRTPNDLESYWIPFTPNRRFKADPRIVVSADGMYYKSDDGRDILDGSAGLWCVNAGHRRPQIVEAIQKQAAELDYAPNFQFSHPKAFELANRLAALFPEGMNHVFYTNSGSESVDTALKMALHYHRMRGDASRTRFIGRERGYHGVGFGGISVGGMVANRKHYGNMLQGVDHLPHTHNLSEQAFTKGCPEWGAHLADDLERLIALHDASTIAAVIVEPMAGSTGVLPPPKGYLEKLRAITKKHGILLIFDEVICAYGRLGKATGAEYFGVTPDIITSAKGLTNGVVPMGAVIVQDFIYENALENADAPIELFHGYTYSGHPLATAAALATLDTYRDEQLFERAASLEGYMGDAAFSVRDSNHVIDIRSLGLVAAVELAPRPGAPGERGYEVMVECFKKGLMTRVSGDTLAFSPPLIVEKSQIDQMFGTLADVLKTLA